MTVIDGSAENSVVPFNKTDQLVPIGSPLSLKATEYVGIIVPLMTLTNFENALDT